MPLTLKRVLLGLTAAGGLLLLSGCHVMGAHGALYLGHHGHYSPAPTRHDYHGDYYRDHRYRHPRSQAHSHERHYRRY